MDSRKTLRRLERYTKKEDKRDRNKRKKQNKQLKSIKVVLGQEGRWSQYSLLDNYIKKHGNSIRRYIRYSLTSKNHTIVFIVKAL